MEKVLRFTIFLSVLMSFRVESCFIPKSLRFVVPQTIPAGFQITKVEAVGCEPSSLRLSSSDPSFTVQSNGVLVSVRPVSVVETGERTFSVRVQDNNGPGSEMEVHLVCEQKNQKGQVVLRRTKRRWSPPPFNIRENEKGPFPRFIETVVSDSSQNHSVYYTLTGPGANLFPFGIFSLNSDTGELYVHDSVDREEYPKFKLIVEAREKATGKQTDLPLEIQVIVDDENDNAPQFIEPLQFTVAEQRSVGTPVAKVSSADRDAPETDHVRVRYKLLSGSDFFAINPETGIITTVTNTLDRETKDKHMVTMEVRDMKGAQNGLFSTATATITLSDINDNPPTFYKPSYKATIPENQGETLLLRIPVEDKDLINTPNWISKFVITKGNENGNFRIETDPKTNDGLLYVSKPLDYEQNSNVNLEISARNVAELNGTTAQWQSVPVNVNVTNIDEGPEFSAPTVRFVIKENTPNGTLIGTYTAKDPETKKSDGIMYYKTTDPGAWVTFDKNTGELRVANTIDRESPLVQDGMYNITVRAVDATQKSGTGTVILVIEDVNDNQPKIPPELVMCEAKKDQLSSVVVVAEDKDLPPYSSPFYFSLSPDLKDTWSVSKYNDTAATLMPLTSLPRGIYDIPLIVTDQQGFGDTQTLKLTICQCRNGVCIPKQSSVSLGPLGILALLLPLALLLLLFLLIVFVCMTKREKVELDDMGYGGGILLPSNTEAPGEEVDSNLINNLSMGLDQKSQKGSVKGSIYNSGWVGNKSFSTIGGHSMYDMGLMQPGISTTNVQNYSSAQFEDYGAQLVGSQILGNGMEYTQSNFDYTLSRTWNTNGIQIEKRLQSVEMESDDMLHSYGYEGNGSVAGSVGCCSDYNDSDTLDFLNTLGPKFKTLADVCTKS